MKRAVLTAALLCATRLCAQTDVVFDGDSARIRPPHRNRGAWAEFLVSPNMRDHPWPIPQVAARL
ncbi:MAG: hypothetical protein NZ534_06645, partial [Bacteroidia bacterium]|nr:hypothetical protein [Bacteroidia bacterium]